ncbi:MAG: hypothetical protein RR977_04120 [Oscillospiraceae bacterium]
MPPEFLTVALSVLGNSMVSLFGIFAANKLSNFRIEQLEKKVEKHNNLIERMAVVEQSTKSAHRRIDEMEEN